jgi:hypothetical protein
MIVDTTNGETHSIPEEEEFRYKKASDAISSQNFDSLTEILYPQDFFIFPEFSFIDNSLCLKGEKLPNAVSLNLINNKEQFEGLYNFWVTSTNRNWDEQKKELVTLLNSGGYPITDKGFHFVHFGNVIDNDVFFKCLVSDPLNQYFKDKMSLENIIQDVFGTHTKKLEKVILKNFFREGIVFPEFYTIGLIFSDSLDIQNIIKILSDENKFNNFSILSRLPKERLLQCKSFINKYFKGKDKKLMNFLNKPNAVNSLLQSVSLYLDIKDKVDLNLSSLNFNSFQSLHSILSSENHKLRYPLQKIDVPKNFPALVKNKQACLFEDYNIEYPKSNYDLIKWSAIMNNCIRGYSDVAGSPETLILALTKDGEMFVNMELKLDNNSWYINQFSKYGNNGIKNSDLAKNVFNHIKKEIIYWKEPQFKKFTKNKHYFVLSI